MIIGIRNCPRLLLLVTLITAAAITLGCTDQPIAPDYYSPKKVIPHQDELLAATPPPNPDWTPAEIETLKGLWLGSLPPLPVDPANAVADNPQAAALGHRLFFEARLSANQQVACATCHRPDLFFTDGFAQSFGTRTTQRNAPTLIGAAYSPWLLWDGHKDSLWAQVLEPIEHPDEQGSTRLHAVHLIRQDEDYRASYEAVFGPLPDELANFDRFPDSGGPVEYGGYRANWEAMSPDDQEVVTEIWVNLGKATAAYERLIVPGPSRFDDYVQAILKGDVDTMEQTLSPDEVAGLRLFIGKGNCLHCHSGPLFTDYQFHNTGVPMAADLPPDNGRARGVDRVLADEFNCLSRYSDTANESSCAALRKLNAEDKTLLYAFKTPTLRNVIETSPYMHAGQFESLRQVLDHYSLAPSPPLGTSEIEPLSLSESELAQLETFLRSLTAPPAMASELLKSP